MIRNYIIGLLLLSATSISLAGGQDGNTAPQNKEDVVFISIGADGN